MSDSLRVRTPRTKQPAKQKKRAAAAVFAGAAASIFNKENEEPVISTPRTTRRSAQAAAAAAQQQAPAAEPCKDGWREAVGVLQEYVDHRLVPYTKHLQSACEVLKQAQARKTHHPVQLTIRVLEPIVVHCRQLLTSLQRILHDGVSAPLMLVAFGQTLSDALPSLVDVHIAYLAHYMSIQQYLTLLVEQKPCIGQLIAEFNAEHSKDEGGVLLSDILIMPSQHLVRLPYFLERICAYLKTDPLDSAALQRLADDQVRQVAAQMIATRAALLKAGERMNDAIRQTADRYQAVRTALQPCPAVESAMSNEPEMGPLCVPFRFFVKSFIGNVAKGGKKKITADESVERAHFFVFTDLVLVVLVDSQQLVAVLPHNGSWLEKYNFDPKSESPYRVLVNIAHHIHICFPNPSAASEFEHTYRSTQEALFVVDSYHRAKRDLYQLRLDTNVPDPIFEVYEEPRRFCQRQSVVDYEAQRSEYTATQLSVLAAVGATADSGTPGSTPRKRRADNRNGVADAVRSFLSPRK